MEHDNPYRAPDTAGQSASSLPHDYHRPRRLTVAQVVAWIVLTGVLTVIYFAAQPRGTSSSKSLDSIEIIHNMIICLSAAIGSAGILGMITLVRDKLRGVAGWLQPGHWLLVILSTTCVANALMSLERLLIHGPPKTLILRAGASCDPPSVADYLPFTIVGLATAVAFLVMAIKLRAGWPWRALAMAFMAMTSTSVLHCLAVVRSMSDPVRLSPNWPEILFRVNAFTGVATLLLLLGIGLIDFGRREHRDGLHWLGVVFAGWLCVNTFIWQLILPLLWRWS